MCLIVLKKIISYLPKPQHFDFTTETTNPRTSVIQHQKGCDNHHIHHKKINK